MSIQPGATLGPYRIIEQVGRGGMATVYKAYQPALARYVAIKVLPPFFADEPTFRERFQHEAIAVAGLRHSNILVVFDYGEASGIAYLVSEFVEGGTLADILGKPLSLGRVAAILGPIASALDFAHERGVLHRDIKPSNILLAGGNVPVLSDFGLAKMMGSFSQLTMSGMAVGTPEYMAPEQADGGDLGPSADNYALGVVAYEMLTGRIPFSAETPLAVLLAHLHKPLPLPRTVNPALSEAVEEVLLKGLAKAPEDRYVSATNFVEALVAAGVAGAPPYFPSVPAQDSAPPSDVQAVVDRTIPSGISASRTESPVKPSAQSAGVSAGPTSAPKRALGLPRRAGIGFGLVGLALLAVLVVAVVRLAGDSGSTKRLVAGSGSPTALTRATPVTPAVTTPMTGGNVVLPTATAFPTPLPAGNEWTVVGSPPNGTRGQQGIELKNGRILFAGGLDAYSDPTRLVELYEPAKGIWSAAAPMHEARVAFTTVLLANGDVLAEGGEKGTTVATSAEVYDPRANRWTVTGSMHLPRRFSTATLLENGDVLFVGGEDSTYQPLAGAELYRPSAGVWKTVTAPAFTEYSVTRLHDGRVLVVDEGGSVIYDPANNAWTPTTSTLETRSGLFAVLLKSGKVLVGGGVDYALGRQLSSAEIFDPATHTWAATGAMHVARYGASAAVLTDGRVLVTGGADAKNNTIQSSELYDPRSGRWMDTGMMPEPRQGQSVLALRDGKALIGGGYNGQGPQSDAVFFSPRT